LISIIIVYKLPMPTIIYNFILDIEIFEIKIVISEPIYFGF